MAITGRVILEIRSDGTVGAAGDTIRYFGACDVNGTKDVNYVDDADSNGNPIGHCSGSETFTCPGTGTQTVTELAAYCKVSTGSCNIRLAIYSSDGNTLIAYNTAEFAVSNTTYQWVANTSISGGTLTGGTSYKLFFTTDVSGRTLYYAAKTGSSGISKYNGTDYTTTLPSDLSGISTNNTVIPAWRVKVSGS